MICKCNYTMIETGPEAWFCSHCYRVSWTEYHSNNPDCLGHVCWSEEKE